METILTTMYDLIKDETYVYVGGERYMLPKVIGKNETGTDVCFPGTLLGYEVKKSDVLKYGIKINGES